AFPNLTVFSYPVEIATPNDSTNRIFVVQQKGRVYVFNNNSSVTTKKIFIDLTTKVSQTPVTGLFGMAFHPNYKNNGYFYVHYVFDSAGAPSGRWLKIMRYTVSAANPDTALLNTETFLLKAPLPGSYHNGGKVAFGPDGFLYISFGDGYSGGATAQSKTSLLGKILRINVDSSTGGRNYSIPVSNPLYQNTSGFREEIFAYGIRNMWKFSIDHPTNRIFGGDVGEQTYEEIDLIENGKNYGWNKMEGNHCYPPNICDTTGMGFTRPIFEYPHSEGFAITGGFVYRGSLLPDLFEKYIYGDYVTGKIWALNYDGINPTTTSLMLDTNFLIISFGLDQSNELFICSYSEATGEGKLFTIVNSAVATLSLKTSIEGFFNPQSSMLKMRDTVTVYQCMSSTPYTILDSAKTVIDSLSLSGLCFFDDAPTGKYYIVTRHRNSIETWSEAGGDSLKKGSVVAYDFTTDSTKAFGNNLIKKGNIYCMYSGDVNQDGTVDGTDGQLVENSSAEFILGYVSEDVTGDNFVDGSDLILVENNANNSVVVRP
ncbi:MAG: PQQ-dependent sugar dehydrogenase, partial [Ignavibacteria bacterium]